MSKRTRVNKVVNGKATFLVSPSYKKKDKKDKERIDWKKRYEAEVEKHTATKWNLDAEKHNKAIDDAKHNTDLHIEQCKRRDDNEVYIKHFQAMRKLKNYWITILSIAILIILIALVVTQNRLSILENRAGLYKSSSDYCFGELNKCKAQLDDMTNAYNQKVIDVLQHDNPPQLLWDTCCYPRNCWNYNDSCNHSCEYLIQCGEGFFNETISGWN